MTTQEFQCDMCAILRTITCMCIKDQTLLKSSVTRDASTSTTQSTTATNTTKLPVGHKASSEGSSAVVCQQPLHYVPSRLVQEFRRLSETGLRCWSPHGYETAPDLSPYKRMGYKGLKDYQT